VQLQIKASLVKSHSLTEGTKEKENDILVEEKSERSWGLGGEKEKEGSSVATLPSSVFFTSHVLLGRLSRRDFTDLVERATGDAVKKNEGRGGGGWMKKEPPYLHCFGHLLPSLEGKVV